MRLSLSYLQQDSLTLSPPSHSMVGVEENREVAGEEVGKGGEALDVTLFSLSSLAVRRSRANIPTPSTLSLCERKREKKSVPPLLFIS